LDSCQDAVITEDVHGIVTTWNAAAAKLFGYTSAEMSGKSMLIIVPAELHSEEAEILVKIKDGKRIERYEATRLRKGGDRIKVSLTISPVRNHRGMVIGVSAIARDLSENGQDREARLRLAAIVESSDDAIIGKDLSGTVTSWNQAAVRLYGYTEAEMLGQPIMKIIPDDLHPEEEEILRKLGAGERIDHYETRRMHKNGEAVEVSLTISPIRDFDGRVIGSSKIARDISGRKRMEQVLIQSEKLAVTGRMAATIAHEINNPLDAVMNLVYLARQSVASNSHARKYLLTAEKELERVSHIARQTLGYYRDPGEPVEIRLEQLFEELLAVYHSKLVAGKISVDCAFRHPCGITASKGELMQVFSNLITNAIDAMPQGGVLSISTRQLGEEGIETTIRDKGVGIMPENLPKVFEPFFTTKGNLGTGIGLWVAKQLIEKSGGKITLQSSTVSPENGTKVIVFTPFRR
jgi:PAS domain S-box-containing protein